VAAALVGAAVALAAAPAVLTGCGGSSPAAPVAPPPPAAAIVDIRNVAFNPRSVTVHAGATVAWKFDDGSVAHNVVGSDWRSPDRTSGYFTHIFAVPGTYAYRCTIHSNMDGQVVVSQ
jgi:plastocyanin